MSAEEEKVKRSEKEEVPGYTLFPEELSPVYSPEDVKQLGEVQKPEIFETEHHVYTSPFHYENVKMDNWLEYGDKGVEIAADVGTIAIVEEKPIISVSVVGSGCSGQNYNIVEWWGPGEKITKMKTKHADSLITGIGISQLIKRQRIDNLKGQHNAWVQCALTQEVPDFESIKQAKEFIKRLQDIIYNMTGGYYMPGSLMTGLYENTAYFRIGDTSRSENTVYKVIIRGGGLDYEDPGSKISRYPADYTFRLIDVVVRKSATN